VTRVRGLGGSVAGDLPVDRGFRYGMSVFETFAVWKGRLLFAPQHWQKLQIAALAFFGIDAARFVDEADAIAPTDLAGLSGVLRVYVTAGAGGMTSPISNPGGWMVFEDLPVGPPDGGGMRVTVSREPFVPTMGGFKTGNYWASARALTDAHLQGFDEALVFNPEGHLVGAACGNVFLRLGEGWVTPSTECGARPGVVRAWVLARLPCKEEEIDEGDVRRASACFITNSRLGIAAVRTISGICLLGHSAVGELAQAYSDEFLHG
jgi:branched-subunit amino acid aminotransferase/4-amino-4-deoxychorismate lyase